MTRAEAVAASDWCPYKHIADGKGYTEVEKDNFFFKSMALSMAHDLKLHTATEPLTVKESEPLSLPYSAEDMEEVEYESLPTDNLSAHLLAGGVAGMVEHCAMYPVDSIKVRRSRVMGGLASVLVCGVMFRYDSVMNRPCLCKRSTLCSCTLRD